jgi:hypothetical protein
MSPDQFDAQRVPITADPPSMPGRSRGAPSLIEGERKGRMVNRAGDFLAAISTPNYFPIFTSQFAELSGELSKKGEALLEKAYPGITTNIPPKKSLSDEWNVEVPAPRGGLTVRPEITDHVGTALVFLIAVNVPHALIVIRTPDGKKYSFGYGYHGYIPARESPYLHTLHSGLDKVLPEKLSHAVEPLRGAIYTADMFSPGKDKQADIIWIGILTQSIIDNINRYLSGASNIVFTGEYGDISALYRCSQCEFDTVAPYNNVVCDSCQQSGRNMTRVAGEKNIISILKMRVTLPNIYLESSGFLRSSDYYNCLEWAKAVLNVRYLNCGLMGKPANCLRVTPNEVAEFTQAISSNKLDSLKQIITRIQERLSKPGLTKQLGDCLGLKGGRRRKINKKYTKRPRLHSRRRRRSIVKNKSNKINRI